MKGEMGRRKWKDGLTQQMQKTKDFSGTVAVVVWERVTELFYTQWLSNWNEKSPSVWGWSAIIQRQPTQKTSDVLFGFLRRLAVVHVHFVTFSAALTEADFCRCKSFFQIASFHDREPYDWMHASVFLSKGSSVVFPWIMEAGHRSCMSDVM